MPRTRAEWGRVVAGSELRAPGSAVRLEPPYIDEEERDAVWCLTYSVLSTGTAGAVPRCTIFVDSSQGEQTTHEQLFFRPAPRRRFYVGRKVTATVQAFPGPTPAVDPNASLSLSWSRVYGATPVFNPSSKLWTYNTTGAGSNVVQLGPGRYLVTDLHGGAIVADAASTEHPAWLCFFDSSGAVPGVLAPVMSVPTGAIESNAIEFDLWAGMLVALSTQPDVFVAPPAGYTANGNVQINGFFQPLSVGAV